MAIVVNDRVYLIDCGPGVVRRAAAAAEKNGIAALKAKELKMVFITRIRGMKVDLKMRKPTMTHQSPKNTV